MIRILNMYFENNASQIADVNHAVIIFFRVEHPLRTCPNRPEK